MSDAFLRGCAVLVVLAGCVTPPAGPPGEGSSWPPLAAGASGAYRLTFGTGEAGLLTLLAEDLQPTTDRFGRAREALRFLMVVSDATGAALRFHVLAARDTAALLHTSPERAGEGAAVFAEESPSWYGYPVPGIDRSHDLQRCAFVAGLALPLALARGFVRFDLEGVDYVAGTEGDRVIARPAVAGEGLTAELTRGQGFFPARASVTTPRAAPFCSLEATSQTEGAGAWPLGHGVEDRAGPEGEAERAPWVGGRPPAERASLAFPLDDAWAAALREPRFAAFLRSHPDAYLVQADYAPDLADPLTGGRMAQWGLRVADASGDSLLEGCQRSLALGRSVDHASFAEERRLPYVAPRAQLPERPFDLAWALGRAAEAGIGAYDRVQWFTAERAELVPTPDATLWQVGRSSSGHTESALFSAANGQLVSRVSVPVGLPP